MIQGYMSAPSRNPVAAAGYGKGGKSTIPTKVPAPKGPAPTKSYPPPANGGGGRTSGGKMPSGGVINPKI